MSESSWMNDKAKEKTAMLRNTAVFFLIIAVSKIFTIFVHRYY